MQTQCLFDLKRFEQFMKLVRDEWLDEKTLILAGVTPAKDDKALKCPQASRRVKNFTMSSCTLGTSALRLAPDPALQFRPGYSP